MLSPFCQSLVVPYEGLTLSFCMYTCYVLIWLWDLIVLPLISIILLPSVSSCPISLICLSLKLMLLTIIFYPFQELFSGPVRSGQYPQWSLKTEWSGAQNKEYVSLDFHVWVTAWLIKYSWINLSLSVLWSNRPIIFWHCALQQRSLRIS